MRSLRFMLVVTAATIGIPAVLLACKSNQISSSTAEGRIIPGPDGLTLSLPAGAVAPEIDITIKEAPAGSYPAPPNGVQGKVYAIEPHGTQFASPVTLEMPMPKAAIDPLQYTIWKASVAGSFAEISPDVIKPPALGAKLSVQINSLSFFTTAFSDCNGAAHGSSQSGSAASGIPCRFAHCPAPADAGDSPFQQQICGASSDGGTGAETGPTDRCSPQWVSDPNYAVGTAALTGTYGGLNLADLTFGCVIKEAQSQTGAATLIFTDSKEYCQGMAGGRVIDGKKVLEIGLSNSGTQIDSGGVRLRIPEWAKTTQQGGNPATNPPLCEYSNSDEPADMSDSGQPTTAVTLSGLPQTYNGSISITIRGAALSGTFTALKPISRQQGFPSCCPKFN